MSDIEKYLAYIKLNAIIYDDDIRSDFNYDQCVEYITSKEFVQDLYIRVRVNEKIKNIDAKVKDNILEVVSFIRDNTKDSEVISLLNKIIVSLNTTYDIFSWHLYKEEYLIRNGIYVPRNPNKMDPYVFAHENELLESLRYSMKMDYDTVNSMLNEEEDVFVNEVVKQELLDDNFINTLNAVYYKMSQLYQDDQFRQRSIYVLQSIKDVVLNRSKIYDKEDGYEIDFKTYLRANKLLKQLKK